jgi:ribosomal protein S18 acetylase RimI-like enzyme
MARVCVPILRALPEWFGIEESILQYEKDIDELPTFVAAAGAEALGFLTLRQHNQYFAEILVMGVVSGHHRQGIGRDLVRRAEAWLRQEGTEYLQVKTLGPSRPDEGYARTREFYMAMGFRPMEEFPTLWDESNPALVMVKSIG